MSFRLDIIVNNILNDDGGHVVWRPPVKVEEKHTGCTSRFVRVILAQGVSYLNASSTGEGDHYRRSALHSCVNRDSNPGRNLGRVASYPWTIDAGMASGLQIFKLSCLVSQLRKECIDPECVHKNKRKDLMHHMCCLVQQNDICIS